MPRTLTLELPDLLVPVLEREAELAVLTHNYILAEFVALAEARHLPRERSLEFVADLQDNAAVTVVYVDEARNREALAFLRRRLDKAWSLCDAVSFLLMTQFGETEA